MFMLNKISESESESVYTVRYTKLHFRYHILDAVGGIIPSFNIFTSWLVTIKNAYFY